MPNSDPKDLLAYEAIYPGAVAPHLEGKEFDDEVYESMRVALLETLPVRTPIEGINKAFRWLDERGLSKRRHKAINVRACRLMVTTPEWKEKQLMEASCAYARSESEGGADE